ncbi:MAG TPA: BON domain-containing protein [Opitutaceae bacterium]|nr:BON domain-containing protein [Opitutaceae bacterium]
MKFLQSAFLCGTITLSFLTLGCVTAHRHAPIADLSGGADDSTISSTVSAVLGDDRSTQSLGIAVMTQSGIVQLTGVVRDPKQKSQAENVVSRIKGLKAIDNEIRVQS